MTAKDRARQLCHVRGKLFSAAWNIVSQHKQKQFFGKHTTCGKLTRWRRFKGSEKMCLSDKIWHETCLWVIVTTTFSSFSLAKETYRKSPQHASQFFRKSVVKSAVFDFNNPANSPWNPGGGAAWSCSTVLVVQLIKHHLNRRVSGSLWLQKYKTLTGHYSFRWVMYLYINTIVVKGQKLVSIYDNNNYLKISLQHDLTRD